MTWNHTAFLRVNRGLDLEMVSILEMIVIEVQNTAELYHCIKQSTLQST